MERDFDKPQYTDILYITCLFYPLISGSIGFLEGIIFGVGMIGAAILFCTCVYLPVASLVFARIRKKNKRVRVCIVSTFVGLLAVFFIYSIIALGLMGLSVELLDVGILSISYIISCAIYLFLLRFI